MIAFIFFLLFIPFFALVGVYAERKIAAFIQDRLGPMEVGKYGFLQTFADILKLLQKEDIVPLLADRKLFLFAPFLVYASVFAGFAVIPLTNALVGSQADVGVFYLLTFVSLDIIGLLMAGWGANNKFAMYGAIRSVAQIISYEIPLGLSVICVIITTQTLDLQEISFQQGILNNTDEKSYLLGLAWVEVTNWGGFFTWNIFRMPVLFFAFVVFFIASLAECNRTPFDLPEAESELVAGFQTEYSGMRWAFLMLAEYGMMLLVSFLASILFLGSWNTPLPNLWALKLATYTTGFAWGIFWLFAKAFVLIFLQMWIRWTYPRLRVDQLMTLCWKYLTPFSLILLILCAIWRLTLI
ncbi:MAG: NADH-quinone oxidoreductase subunit H [Cytophagales bacterium]|nr:MAG: NADH-quinone oxidoreductase subunit H [Cytophagales bacterium]